MTRHEIKHTLNIQARPDVVWRLVTDFKRVPEWMKHVVEFSGPKSLSRGATLEIKTRIGSHLVDTRAKVTEFEKGARLGWAHVEDLLDGAPIAMVSDVLTSFDLVPDGKGTRLTGHVAFTPVGLKAKLAAGYIVNKYFKPQMDEALETLKALAEREGRVR